MVEGGFCADGERVCAAEDVQDHVPDDFVVADEVGMFPLCSEEAIDEVFLVFEGVKILHALHEAFDCIACGYCEVIELVELGHNRALAE